MSSRADASALEETNGTRPLPLLAVSGLSIDIAMAGRTTRVVDDVSFEIHDGEAVALVGESGSGKTMTALSILGLLPRGATASGSIRFREQQLAGLPESSLNRIRGKSIAIIYQEPMSSLNPALTVGEQIAETVRHHLGLGRSAAKEGGIELLAMVGIPEPAARIHDYPHMFSGGMLQRVGIAMALSCEPALLIADEPTTALDATVQAQVLELLASLRDKSRTSLLFLTHDFGAVAALCDRAVVMYCGEVVEVASAEALFDRPLHPYTEGLLGAMARLDRNTEPIPIKGTVPLHADFPEGCHFHPRCSYVVPACTIAPIAEIAVASRRVRCRRFRELNLKGSA